MATNVVARLCDRCLREQGQTQLGEAIAEKIERGTVRGMHAARVTFEDGVKVLVKLPNPDVDEQKIIDFALAQRKEDDATES
jgi:aromatic ring-opening dioxygenase catalytic subunit (LigB family)